MNPRHLAFLRGAGLAGEAHSIGSLLNHLTGTAELLEAWGCSRAICVAGLFHSVYGTPVYHHGQMGVISRDTVTALIGKRAERLVYLFSICRRPTDLISGIFALPHGSELDDPNGEKISVTSAETVALCQIECANTLDQISAASRPAYAHYLQILMSAVPDGLACRIANSIDLR